MLETRELGTSGIKVYPIGLGLWAIGGDQWGATQDDESLRMIETALDNGVDFFDTADVYGDGHSEVLLGKAMKGRRDRFIVGTKIGWKGFDGDEVKSAYTSADNVVQAVEENLRRLDTDYVDVLQWHIHFRESTMEHFIEGCEKLKAQGKLRAYGLSSSDAPYIKAFAEASDSDVLQNDYSILNRTSEQDIFPLCEKEGLGVVVRGGLAMGILSGKFSAESTFPEDDFRKAWVEDEDQRAQFLQDLQTVDQLKKAFPNHDLAQLSIRFVVSQPQVSVMIAGAKRPDQVMRNLAAAEHGLLTDDEQAGIDAIVPKGGGRKIWPA